MYDEDLFQKVEAYVNVYFEAVRIARDEYLRLENMNLVNEIEQALIVKEIDRALDNRDRDAFVKLVALCK